ncbi:MAG: MYG1 family protein [Candidatus Taylorbacteria bacterium]|nr:MYG1 family protein [Candidatus Taylorbacteria bacterium]
MDKAIVIATHDGHFHADDCFSVATLLLMLDTVPVVSTVIRTRDEDVIKKADFVVDVGGEHRPENNRFDHHQEGGAGARPNTVPYASFGLVWSKFGKDICGSKEAASKVDKVLVAPVDADDSGFPIYSKIVSDVVPYKISDFVHDFRPTWQEDQSTLDARFLEAVGFARKILERVIAQTKSSLLAKVEVIKMYEKSEDKRIVVLDSYYPHEQTLSELPEPVFSIYSRPDGKWTAKALRDDVSSFKNKKDFPASWAGKRDAELVSISGVSDAVFCHNGRFMAVAKTKEGSIELAKLALKS